jgi:AraC family transcriptional regulator
MGIVLESGHFFGVEKQASSDDSFTMNITHYDPFAKIQRHAHKNAYLSLLINGNYSEKGNQQEVCIGAGEVIFRPAGYEHANEFPRDGGNCLNLEIKRETIDRLELTKHLPRLMKVYERGELGWLYQVFYEFRSGQKTDFPEEHLLNWLTDNAGIDTPLRLPWLSSVTRIIDSEYEVHHSLQSLAQRVFVHPVYLARCFKQKTGSTIGDYQSKVRMKKASELIFTTDKSISDIAFTTGFSDPAHLVRSFRQYYKTSPARFRKQLKG